MAIEKKIAALELANVLFDLEGTLLNPRQSNYACFSFALKKLGREVLTADLDWTIGPPLRQSFAIMLNSTEPVLLDQAITYYREYYHLQGKFDNQVYSGIEVVLTILKEQKYKLFVATSKPTIAAKEVLKFCGLGKFFQGVYGSEATGTATDKQDLIANLLSAEKIEAARAIMIGDTRYDIMGAKHNKILAGGATWGYGTIAELKQAGVDYLFHKPEEIALALVTHIGG